MIHCRANADRHGDHIHQEQQELAGFHKVCDGLRPFGSIGYSEGIVDAVTQCKHSDAVKEDKRNEGPSAYIKNFVAGNVIVGGAAAVVPEQVIGLRMVAAI